MLGDQANILNRSYSKDQGVQVEGIKDSFCTNKMLTKMSLLKLETQFKL